MTAHFPHPLTSAQRNAQRQAQHRLRVKAKLARLAVLEAALREIADPDPWAEADVRKLRERARTALNHTPGAREEVA